MYKREEEKIKGAKALAEVYGGGLANKEKNDKEKTTQNWC